MTSTLFMPRGASPENPARSGSHHQYCQPHPHGQTGPSLFSSQSWHGQVDKTTRHHTRNSSRFRDSHRKSSCSSQSSSSSSDSNFDEVDGCPMEQRLQGSTLGALPQNSIKNKNNSLSQKSPGPCGKRQPVSLEDRDSGFVDGEDDDVTQPDSVTSARTEHNSSLTKQGESLTKSQLKRQRRRARKVEEESLVVQSHAQIKKALREENDRLKQQLYCRVCMDAPVSALLLPCRHSVLCWTCAQKLNPCPICREKIQSRISVYLVGL